MNIEAKGFKIDMTHQEAYNTAFNIRRCLEKSLKEHWVNHQSSWMSGEKETLYRLQTFFDALGRHDLYEEIYFIADAIFKEFNEIKDKE
jgi:hypothetical protein